MERALVLIDAWLNHHHARFTATIRPPHAELADTYCARAQYVSRIREGYGEMIGYKVGFTGIALQERFKIYKPAIGVLLDKMMVPDGSTVSTDFGFRALIEPQMVVTV